MKLSSFSPPSVNFKFKHIARKNVEMSPQLIALQKRTSNTIKKCQKSLINNLIEIKKLEIQNAMQQTLLLISECVDFMIHNYLTQAKIIVNPTTVDKLFK
jgi:hypothetical protein